MAKENGGVIGVLNTPSTTTASGVWALQDQYEAKRNGNWPRPPFVSPNSLRFNSGSSDSLTRTPSVAGNRQIWTWSGWIKKTALASRQNFFQGGNHNTGSNSSYFEFSSGDVLRIAEYNGSIETYNLDTTQVFRDVSAFYHIVIAFDTTQATASNRVKLYVNGNQVTSFSASNYPSQNSSTSVNNTVVQNIGRDPAGGFAINGYMSEVILVDGQQLTPSSFGASNASGVWYPIPYAGSYGTNGFNLKFGNSASLGTDSSPNGNNFTVNNLTSVDQSTDTELNNWNTLNSISSFSGLALSEGNLKIVGDGTGLARSNCTFGLDTGKWYFEAKLTTAGSNTTIGIGQNNLTANYPGQDALSYAYDLESGNKINSNSQPAYGSALTTNDIFMCAFDLTNSKIFFGKNGTWFASSDPVTGASPAYTLSSGVYNIIARPFGNGATVSMNFGAGTTYAANSYADGAGYGNFSYAVPSGYYALCTANLNTYG